MRSDKEVYEWLNDQLDDSVDRTFSEVNADVGEFFCATTDLVEAASEEGKFTQGMMDVLKQEYPAYEDYSQFDFYPVN